MAPTATAKTNSHSVSATSRPKKGLKAKCAENQEALDKLVAKRATLRPNENFGYTVKRAMESLQKSKEPVLTYKDALKLQGVGPTLANMMYPDLADADGNDTSQASRPRKRKAAAKKKDTVLDAAGAAYGVEAPFSPNTQAVAAASTDSVVATKRRRPVAAAAHTTGDASQMIRSLATEKPTAKEVAYQMAVTAAENYIGQSLTWRALLLVDGRERKSEHIQAKCQMSGIPCEERHLPIGDMAWLAQGTDPVTKKVVSELMLGTIIERKSVEDLKSSLFGTRYWEQRLRLQHSGIPQVLFLIEGDLNKDLYACPAETLRTAVMETRLHLGFQIVQTAHMDGTVVALKRMHRRILQRSFPYAFGLEALPTFAEVGVAGTAARRRDSVPDQERRRHRRQRLSSLMEMKFDCEPVPPLGTSRFITYQELKAKVERDREAGTKTIGSIHAAMLKQVSTISSKKVRSLSRAYPTTSHMLQAFANEPDSAARQGMVTDLETQEPGQVTARASQMGPRSATELYVAYASRQHDGESEDEFESEQAGPESVGRRASYSDLVQQAQAEQRLSQGSTQESEVEAPVYSTMRRSSYTELVEKAQTIQRLSQSSSQEVATTTSRTTSTARAKLTVHDAAFWEEDGSDADASLTQFALPVSTTATTATTTAVPVKKKPTIQDEHFWDDYDDSDDDDTGAAAAPAMKKKKKAAPAVSSPGSFKENIYCVDLTTPALPVKKKRVAPVAAATKATLTFGNLDSSGSSDDDDDLETPFKAATVKSAPPAAFAAANANVDISDDEGTMRLEQTKAAPAAEVIEID